MANCRRSLLVPFLLPTLVSLAALICVLPAFGQTVPDNRGRDFWIVFPPNYHNEVSIQPPSDGILRDSSFIFVAADRPTSGRITYRDIQGVVRYAQFSINAAPWLYKFAVLSYGYEIEGYNNSVSLVTSSQNGRICPQYFHVEADQDVAVYGMNQTITTSDALMALPTDVLGTRYRVMSYSSDGKVNAGGFPNGQTTPSEFVVTAVQNGTSVTITPRVPALGNPANRSTVVTLNQGESFLVQADVVRGALNGDLTGSLVVSDKPVAVFGGQQRATVPIGFADTLTSRDYLLEQLPPTSVWSTTFILTPFAPGGKDALVGYDLARVLADSNGTEVRLGGAVIGTLQAGEFLDIPLRGAGLLTATRPVMVAQYKKSSQLKGETPAAGRLGDPFMIVVPPQKQYLTSYLCTNAQVSRPGTPKVYLNQYMTIIAPMAFLNQTRVDGQVVAGAKFIPIDGTCYSYTIIEVEDGVHRVECPLPICVYFYGYGYADSYGYVAGMKFDVDPEPPVTVAGDTAFCIGGTARLRASGGIEYRWSGDATLSCTDCDTPSVAPQKTSTCWVTITDTYGCIHYDSVHVVVYPLPVARADRDTAVCLGTDVPLHASGGVAYRWEASKDLSCLDCSDPIALPTATTTYRVQVLNSEGCADLDSVTVTVYPLPKVAMRPDTTICTGDSAWLGASGGVSYRWSPPTGLSCADCAAPLARPTATTTYSVEVFNAEGCSSMGSTTIGVRDCLKKADLSIASFPGIMACDTSMQACRVSNVGEMPVLVTSVRLADGDVDAFTLDTTGLSLPRWIDPSQEILLPVWFHPLRRGSAAATVRAYLRGADDSISIPLSAEGRGTSISFRLEPDDPTAVPGEPVDFLLKGDADSWEDAAITGFTAEAMFNAAGIAIAAPSAGSEFPDDWTWDAHTELRGGEKVVVIEASGPTPLAAGGTLIRIPTVVYLSDTLDYTPGLTVAVPDRERCVTAGVSAATVALDLCGGLNRTFQITNSFNRIAVQGTSVRYSLAFGGRCRITLYDGIGRKVVDLVDGTVGEGEHEVSLPVDRISSGMYLVRMETEGYGGTVGVIVGR